MADAEAAHAAANSVGVSRVFCLGSHEQPLGGGDVVFERLLDVVPFFKVGRSGGSAGARTG